MPVIDLLKKSFEDYLKKIWRLAGLALFSCLAALAFLPFAGLTFFIVFAYILALRISLNLVLADILLFLVGLFLGAMLGVWSQTAIFFAVIKDELNFLQALKISWKKIGSFFWVALLAGLANFAGFLLLIIPGIIFSVWFAFSPYVFVAENLRGIAALKRSRELVRGRWWPVFGRILVITGIAVIVSWIKFIGPLVAVFILAPYTVVYFYLLYQDLNAGDKQLN